MKRHPALEPFSRDHNVGLILARRLMRNEASAVTEFQQAWQEELEDHFDEEERLLSPLLLEEMRARLFAEHDALRKSATSASDGSLSQEGAAKLGQLLDEHIRWEERELFEWIQQHVPEPTLESLSRYASQMEARRTASTMAPRRAELVAKRQVDPGATVDLNYFIAAASHTGPVWSEECEDLDITLLRWAEREAIAEHINNEVDVIVVCLQGSGEVSVGETTHHLSSGMMVLIPKGQRRSFLAGSQGFAHLNIHKRRQRLQVGKQRPPSQAPAKA
jgi:quercetin dioxygenase-like cupin family protein/hemerythrin